MALVLKDRVRETTTTTGTSTLTLDGAVTGYQTFSSAIGNTNTTYYAISSSSSSEWEVGIGTVSAGQLSRDTILASSNSGSAVNLSAGTKDVFVTYPASKSVKTDDIGVTVQEFLISGTNIKTINDSSILGSGNLAVASNAKIYFIGQS